jgi:hypothetical protein
MRPAAPIGRRFRFQLGAPGPSVRNGRILFAQRGQVSVLEYAAAL